MEETACSSWISILALYNPIMLSHFSPAPVKVGRLVRIQ